MKTVVAATNNEGKLDGLRAALELHGSGYGLSNFHLKAVGSDSGVSDTPANDEEGLLGCKNRLEFVMSVSPGADLYVAMEGIVTSVRGASFVRGWTTLYDVAARRFVSASGASTQVPTFITDKVQTNVDFNHIVRDSYPLDGLSSLELRDIGGNGVFTGGEYIRQDSFYDGVRICLALLENPNNWIGE